MHAETIPFSAPQPLPSGVAVVYVPAENPTSTVIMREWQDGEPPRCKRCPYCTATRRNNCVVFVPRLVPGRAAATFAYEF